MKRFLVIFAALLLVGCAGFRNNQPTRCPRCGWLMEQIASGTFNDEKGKYAVVEWRCLSLACLYVVDVTNYYSANVNATNGAFSALPR